MKITGEQFHIMCVPCLLLVIAAKNLKELERHWPSWDEKTVFVDCFKGNCPKGLLSQDGDEVVWQLVHGIRKKSFEQWWQEILTEYDKLHKKHPRKIPARPSAVKDVVK